MGFTTFTPMMRRGMFWSKVKIGTVSECWTWTGARRGSGMYGAASDGKRQVFAHRFAYESERGKIPAGLTIDHLCRNHLCVNPWHLEAVTAKENLLRGNGAPAANARKTHCKRGHALSGDNLYAKSLRLGWRVCKTCARGAAKAYSKRKKQ